MIPNQNLKMCNNPNIKEQILFEKIELLIQQKYNCTIPALFFEYLSQDSQDFEANDLKSFFIKFGEVCDFICKGKTSIVLYKHFIDAETCREFLMNENNFKENLKNNFSVRWFNYEKDSIPPEIENKLEKIHNKNVCNIMDNNKSQIPNMMNNSNKNKINNGINNKNNINNIKIPINNINQSNQNHINLNINQNQNTNNIFMPPNIIMQYNQIKMNQGMQMNGLNNLQQNMHPLTNFGIQNMMLPPSNLAMFMNQNLGGMNNLMGMQMNNLQYNTNQKQFNQNMEEKNYGKYTCKYEILIPNDKEFQVARRLIGSKGCNMKKILNECKTNNNVNDNIKLRLRGRGSGYKEGPQNKESDEPLHLCISAKNQEEMKKACAKVDELLNKIYEEYKKFCIKNNITPVASQLANRIDCGNSLHKTK